MSLSLIWYCKIYILVYWNGFKGKAENVQWLLGGKGCTLSTRFPENDPNYRAMDSAKFRELSALLRTEPEHAVAADN